MISRCQFTVDSSQLVWCVDGVNRIVCDVCLCACRWLCGRVNESEMLAWWTMWNLPAFTWNRGSHQNNNNSRVLRTLHVDEDHLAQLQSMSMRSDVHKNNIGPSVLIPLLCFVTKLWSSQWFPDVSSLLTPVSLCDVSMVWIVTCILARDLWW